MVFSKTPLPHITVGIIQSERVCDTQASHRNSLSPHPPGGCRAGTTTPFAFGETITPEFVNYDGGLASGSTTTKGMRGETIPVGSLGVANAFGLYDTHGNVWEWCLGEYHDSYRGAPTDGSPWLTTGDEQHHVVRGGSWNNLDIDTRSANRSSYAHDGRYNDIGFRLLMELEQNAQ